MNKHIDSAIQEALVFEHNRKMKTGLDAHAMRHTVIYFWNPEREVFKAYDAAHPSDCINSVFKSHPEWQFVTLRAYPDSRSAREFCSHFNAAADVIPELTEIRKAVSLRDGYAAATPPTSTL